MGSSAQNSSGVDWCRRWIRFNEIPEKLPKVLEKVWEALVQSQVKEKIREKIERFWCRVRFNKIPEKILEKVPGGFGTTSGQASAQT